MDFPLLNWSITMFMRIAHMLTTHNAELSPNKSDIQAPFVLTAFTGRVILDLGRHNYSCSISDWTLALECCLPSITGRLMNCEESNTAVILRITHVRKDIEVTILAHEPNNWYWYHEASYTQDIHDLMYGQSLALLKKDEDEEGDRDESVMMFLDELIKNMRKPQ